MLYTNLTAAVRVFLSSRRIGMYYCKIIFFRNFVACSNKLTTELRELSASFDASLAGVAEERRLTAFSLRAYALYAARLVASAQRSAELRAQREGLAAQVQPSEGTLTRRAASAAEALLRAKATVQAQVR